MQGRETKLYQLIAAAERNGNVHATGTLHLKDFSHVEKQLKRAELAQRGVVEEETELSELDLIREDNKRMKAWITNMKRRTELAMSMKGAKLKRYLAQASGEVVEEDDDEFDELLKELPDSVRKPVAAQFTGHVCAPKLRLA